jgi:hypothetical protein
MLQFGICIVLIIVLYMIQQQILILSNYTNQLKECKQDCVELSEYLAKIQSTVQ